MLDKLVNAKSVLSGKNPVTIFQRQHTENEIQKP